MTDATIHEQSQSIRDIVFNPLMEHLFLKSNADRFQIAACLDTIEDAHLAVEEYRQLDFSNNQPDKGKLYLAVYGVLQGIFLQQDALMNLANALHFPCQIDDYQVLKQIREIRNQSVGHPTSFRRNKVESYYAINRSSLSLARFEMIEYNNQASKSQVISVYTIQTLSDNEAFITRIMEDIETKLKADIDKHKAKYCDNPLAALFPDSLGYMCAKLLAGALHSSSESDRHLASAAVKVIENMLCDIRNTLSERGKPPEAWSGVDLVWRELQYPMKAIKAFYCNENDNIRIPYPETVQIFAWYMKSKLNELRNICREIDDYYDSDQVT